MTTQNREAAVAALLDAKTIRLAQGIRQSAWFQEKQRSLGRNEFPTLAQVIALVDRVATAAIVSAAQYPTPVTDQREMAGWMRREQEAYEQGKAAGIAEAREPLDKRDLAVLAEHRKRHEADQCHCPCYRIAAGYARLASQPAEVQS